MTRIAWFHCFSGIAGDMALGSLLDAGADLDEVRSMVEQLPVRGWGLEAEGVLRCGIAATKAHVHAEGSDSSDISSTGAKIPMPAMAARSAAGARRRSVMRSVT